MKTMSKDKAAEVKIQVEAVHVVIGKVHDQLETMQKPRTMRTSALIRNLIGLRMYDGPVDLGLQADLDATLKGIADELDFRVPIPVPDVLVGAEGP